MRKPKVLVSILNWNKAKQTLECVQSLATERDSADLTVLVIDNGSAADDVALLMENAGGAGFIFKSLPKNLGFTGGHNVAIDVAQQEQFDFIWLLNNDSMIVPGALRQLLDTMDAEPRCGAASPVVRDIKEYDFVTSCLNTHDWERRSITRYADIEQARQVQLERPGDVWLLGTGILFRMSALNETGKLDERLFAYYDDDDIGSRLAAAGWTSKCVFDASIVHDTRRTSREHPLYYYYLMQRNEMLFWYKNTPSQYRRLLWLKVVDTALFDVNRLYRQGLLEQGDAALLGVYDFICGRFGAPDLKRKAPVLMRLACRFSARMNRSKFLQPAVAA